MDRFTVKLGGSEIGYLNIYSDSDWYYSGRYTDSEELKNRMKELGLDRDVSSPGPIVIFDRLMRPENIKGGTRRLIYTDGELSLERIPEQTGDSFLIYRVGAEKGEEGYSPKKHDAPHYEGPKTPEGMREWASWYQFNKMDDGTYEAELDEAWWWGGGHNDGGTIHALIPEEWLGMPWKEFISNVLNLAFARHYGFTEEELERKDGLKEFFGYVEERE